MSIYKKAQIKREEREEKFFSSLDHYSNIAGYTVAITIVILQLLYNQIAVG